LKPDSIYRTGDKALVFDIQRFSLHDGPGIRTVVFFKGCPLRCLWCQNPESLNPYKEIAFYDSKCIDCRRCIPVCKEKSIVRENLIRVNRQTCNGCGDCASECPSSALRLVGRYYEPEVLLNELLKDKPFFDTSGGGVTFSGGEPALQWRFLKRLIPLCKKVGIHTAIETCGYFNLELVYDVIKAIDLILYDIKIIDEKAHINFTGRSNKIILYNIRQITRFNNNIIPRLPLIPGYTTDRENLLSIVKLLKELGYSKLHLLPYHAMGESKIKPIESKQPFLHLPRLSEKDIYDIQDFFSSKDIETILWGWV